MRLLQIAGTMDPNYGGPPVVVNQLTRTLGDLGHHVDVLTLDAPSAPWLRNLPGRVYALGGTGKYRYSSRLRPWLRARSADYDCVIVHGIWQYQSRAAQGFCRELGLPYFLFIHGALDPWFRQHYPIKHLKKAIYWRLFERRSVRDAQALLFTCEEERRLARTSFKPYKAAESVIGLGIDEPPGDPSQQRAAFLSAYPDLRGKRLLLFLGRLHAKKGCDLLVQAFADVCAIDDKLHLVIAGPDEDGSERSLRLLIDSLGVSDRVTWTGLLSGDLKWGAFRAADAFALTSHSENFGIAIAEALSCGVPVLISDKVNIWREIQESGGGLVESDDSEGAKALLGRWLSLSDMERSKMRENARRCFLDEFESRRAASCLADSIARSLESRARNGW